MKEPFFGEVYKTYIIHVLSIYEQVNNYFVLDINTYNSNIKKFNDYQKSNNSTITLKNYKTKKDYIDFNEDGTIEGKDE